MVDVNWIYFWFNTFEFLENAKNPRTGNSKLNDVWLMIFWIVWGFMIVLGAENDWPSVFSFKCKESWYWSLSSNLFKLRSKKVIECFQNLFYDCCSIIGLCGSCRNGLHFLNSSGSFYPSRPAQAQNENWKSMLKLLQFVAKGLNHSYDVYGRCLSD